METLGRIKKNVPFLVLECQETAAVTGDSGSNGSNDRQRRRRGGDDCSGGNGGSGESDDGNDVSIQKDILDFPKETKVRVEGWIVEMVDLKLKKEGEGGRSEMEEAEDYLLYRI